jgi:predicted regulator of Ras-like GTPase activity (Roadblock/LC7/MglB family)
MQELLRELQGKQGVIGSFIIEDGKIASSSIELSLELSLEVAQKLFQISNLTHKNTSFEYLIHEGKRGKILIYNLNGKLLAILLSPTANPLVIHSLVKRNKKDLNEREKREKEKERIKEKLEFEKKLELEGEKEILAVNTSSYPSRLDLILHLRGVYGSDRFLATRFLELDGKALGEISRELKLSVEAIKDLIARDPTIFSIKKDRRL